jgi:SAM-dependent methyltransferase
MRGCGRAASAHDTVDGGTSRCEHPRIDASPGDNDETLIRDQIEFYRKRAPQYPQTIGPDDALDDWVLAYCPASRHCLELASGSGLWTRPLLRVCQRITAVDASPEMHERNRARNGDSRVGYVVANLFDYRPPAQYDLVFAGFWLSHVPPARFPSFWSMVADALAPVGRVVMVDDGIRGAEAVSRFANDPTGAGATRRLPDGREFTIVKVAYAPEELEAALSELGWIAEVTPLSPVTYVLEAHR